MEHTPARKYPAPPEKIRVMFVCSSNLNRSPRAEEEFRKLMREHGLEHRFMVHSSGVNAFKESGGLQFDPEMAERYHVIFAADFATKKSLLKDFHQPKGKIIDLGIPDIYSRDSPKLGEILNRKLRAWLVATGHIKPQGK